MKSLLKLLKGLLFRRRHLTNESFLRALTFRIALHQVEHGPISYKSSITPDEHNSLARLMEGNRLFLSYGSGTVEVSLGLRVEPLNRNDLTP